MPDPQKLIPTKRLIEIACSSGFDFGKGNPNNRLRYWTKIGLIPHALRKKIGQNEFTEGHYPYYTLNLLRQIQLLKKAGFNNEEIKRRMKKELAKYVVKEAGVEIRKPKNWKIGLGAKTIELSKKLTIATLCFIVIALVSLWVRLTPSGQAKFNQLKADFGKYLVQLIEPYLWLVSPVPEEEKVAGVKAQPATGLLSPLASENMISNSSFEAGNLNAEPKGWGFIGQSGSFNTQVSLESIRTGTKGLKINDPACSSLYNKNGCQLGVSQPTTKTINGRDYLFTVYVRSHNLVGSPKLRLMLLGGEGKDRYQDFSLPTQTKPEYSDWQQFKTIFKNAPLNYYPAIEVLDYQGGTVYLDDVGFYETVSPSTVIADFNLPSTSEVSESFTTEVSLGGEVTFAPTSYVTEQANIRLGDGSMIANSSSNLYPLGGTLGPGSLGIDSHRFGGLYLTHTSIDGNGNIDSDGTLTVRDKFVADHNLQLGSDANDSLDVRAELISDLIPDADNQYDLGSSSRQWAEAHVNSLTAGSTTMGGNITMPDDSWIGLGAAKGRIEFDDQGTDEINILSANVGLGTATPGKKLDVVGGDIRSDADLHGGDLYLGYDDDSATLTTTDTNEDLTLDPNGTGDLYFHGSTYQLSDTGDLTLGGRITFENAAYIQNETNGTLYFNEPTIQLDASTAIDVDSPTLDLSTQATDIELKDNTASALTISESTNEYLNISTTDTTTSFSLNLPVAGSTSTIANLFTSNLAKTINLGTGTAIDTINIGTGGTSADDINIGDALADVDVTGASQIVAGTGDSLTITANAASTWSAASGDLTLDAVANSLNLYAGEDAADSIVISSDQGGIDITTASTEDIDITGSGGVNLSSSETAAGALSLQTTGSNAATTLVLSSAGTGATAIDIDSSGGIEIDAAASATIALEIGAAGTLNFGADNVAKTINLGIGTAADTINIGTGDTAADDINLGGLATSTIDLLGVTKLGDGGSTNYAQFSATGDLTLVGSADTITGPGSTLTITNPGANIALQTTTSGDITATTGASTGLFNVLTGNLKVGNATPTYTLDGEDAYIEGNLEVDGNVYLGDSTADSLTVSGYVTSNLIPDPGSQYDLGSNTRKWLNVWADTVTASNLSGTVVTGSTSSYDWTIGVGYTGPDAQDMTLTFERGGPATNAEIRWDSTNKYISTNAPGFVIAPDSGITASGKAALIVDQIQNQDILTASASGTPKFVITNAGNVGIGTTGPTGKLSVAGGVGIGTTAASSPYHSVATPPDGGLIVEGNVGIGTTNPGSYKLNVQGNIYGLGTLTIAGTSILGDSATTVSFDAVTDFDLATSNASAADIDIGTSSQANTISIGTSTAGSTLALDSADWGITTTGVIDGISGYTQDDGSFSHTGSTSTLDLTGAVSWDTDSSMTLGAQSYALTADGGTITITGDGTNDINLVNTNANLDIDVSTIDLSTQATTLNLADSQTRALNIESGLLNLDTFNTRVGIGTTAPASTLEVVGETRGTRFAFQDDTDTYLDTLAANKIVLATGGSDRLTIDSSGNVGIGTTGPSEALDVVGDLEVSGVGQFGGITGTAYSAISDSGTATYAASDDDLYIEDILEVGGASYFSGTLTTTGQFTLGDGGDTGSINTSDWAISTTGVMTGITGITTDDVILLPDGSAAAPALSFSGDTDTGLYRIGDDKISLITGGTVGRGITIDSSGNVGIGTTGPSQKLHVEGQCVTEDSLVPVATECQISNDKCQINDKFQISNVQIKDVKGGDMVLSLDEETGQFEWQKVEKTLDKGIQEVYELVTETGKRIETTGNHPYLARSNLEGNINQEANDQSQGGSDLSIGAEGQETIHLVNDFSNKTVNSKNTIPKYKSLVNTQRASILDKSAKFGVTKAKANQAAERLIERAENALSQGVAPFINLSLTNNNNSVKWTKVIYLKVGNEIATLDGWEKITSIKITGHKHVYDLQIANTHNFVANGIIAHNTYISSNLEVDGTTQLDGQFTLGDGGDTGAISTSDWAISTTGVMTGITGITTDDVILLPDGSVSAPALAFSGDTDTGIYRLAADKIGISTGATARIAIDATGQVGIGTTGPSEALDVVGDLEVSGVGQFGGITGTAYSAISDSGTATYAASDDDLYIEDILEVGGASYLAGTLTTTGQFTLGDGGDTGSINTSDWDISTTGVMTGITGITTDGVLLLPDGSVSAPALSFSSDTNTGLYRIGDDKISLITGGTVGRGITIDSSGNVGIGTTGPGSLLEIYNSSASAIGPTLTLNNPAAGANSGAAIDFKGYSGLSQPIMARIRTYDDDLNSASIGFLTKAQISDGALSEKMWISSTGNVGIGTTGPSEALDVVGDLEVSGVGQFGGITGTAYSAISDSGTATYAASDDDLYIEDILEVGGASYFAGTLTSNGQFTLGDGGDTGAINTSDWDISTTGVMTGISGITTDGVLLLPDGSVSAPALSFSSDTNTGLYRIGDDKISLITGGTVGRGITIDSSGNTGIGTTGPGYKLDVAGTGRFTEAVTLDSTLGVTGTTTLAGALDANGDVSIADTDIAFDGASTTFTTTGAFTLTPGGAVTLGDGGDTMYINSSDWDISTTGVMTGITGITTDDVILLPDGSVSAPALAFNGDTDTGIYRLAADKIGISTGATARIAIDATGQVGIGTTGPSEKLDVVGDLEVSGVGQFGGITGTAYSAISDSGTATYAASDDDLYIEDILEVGGASYFAGTLTATGQFTLGDGGDTGSINTSDWAISTTGVMTGITGITTDDVILLPDGSVSAPALSFSSDTDTGIYRLAADKIGIATGATARIVVDSTGQVGIGTTSPGAALDLRGAQSDTVGLGQLLLGDSTAAFWSIRQSLTGSTGGYDLNFEGNYGAGFHNYVTIRRDTGNVGIGTTGPGYKLDVAGTGRFTGAVTLDSTLGVTGTTTLAGALDANGEVTIADTNISFDGASTTFTTTGAFTLTPGGAVTLGDGGDTMYINSSDWDISTTGVMTGITGITTDDVILLPDGSAAAPALSFSGDTDTGLYRIGADKISLITGGTVGRGITIDSSGNTGIGTTGPSQKLHVEGNCVTGDSQLIREDGQVLRVDQVRGGEKVYSLDQETNKLVPAKILALLDMGVKPVYRLKTQSGKTIETTANHPYLTPEGWKKVAYLQKGQQIAVAGKNLAARRFTILGTLRGDRIKNQNQEESNHYHSEGNLDIGIKVNKVNHNSPLFSNQLANSKQNIAETKLPVKTNWLSSFDKSEKLGEIATAPNQPAARFVNNPEKTLAQDRLNSFSIKNNHIIRENSLSTDILWERIVSIEYVGEKQVWDLSIENTHNFVANGIIAHNTYISSNLEVDGTTQLDGQFTLGDGGDTGSINTSDWAISTTGVITGITGITTDDVILLPDGTVSAPALSFSSDTDTGLYRLAADKIGISTGATARIAIDATGQVGIGTTGPSEALDVVGDLEVSGVGQFGGITGTAYSAISDSGTATYAASDDDLYIEDILEVGGASYLAGTLTTTGQFTLGDGGDTGAINTSDWDISTTGVMTGITGITTDDVILLPDGTASAPALAFSSDTDTGLYRLAADKIGISTGATARIVVDSTGQVGIGTTGPVSKLHIHGNHTNDGTGGFMLDATDTSDPEKYVLRINPYVVGGGMVGYIFQTKSSTGGTQTPLVFDNAGNVGIGTTSPGHKLNVVAADDTVNNLSFPLVVQSSNALAANVGGGIAFGGVYTGTSQTQWASIVGRKENATDGNYAGYLAFFTRPMDASGEERIRITSAGNVGIGTTGPSEALDVVGDLEVSGVGQFGGITGTAYSAISDSGTATYAASDDDLYIEDILEVGGASYFAGTLTTTGQFTLGDGGDTGSINTSDWDISTTGVMTGITGITTDDVILLPDGTVSAPALSFSSDTDTGLYRIGADKISLITGGTVGRGITIDSSGNVGIGTTGPGQKLSVYGANVADVRLSLSHLNVAGNTTYEGQVYQSANNLIIRSIGDTGTAGGNRTGSMLFKTNNMASGVNTEYDAVTITSTGNVGIGTTGPSEALDVVGDLEVSGVGQFGGITGTAYSAISDSGTATYAASDDDLYIEDILEVGGASYFAGTLTTTGQFTLGDGGDTGAISTSDWAISTTGVMTGISGITTDDVILLPDGTASAPALAFSGDTDTGIYRLAADKIGISTGATARIVVDSTGQVGIGTTGPGAKLGIAGQGSAIRLGDQTGGKRGDLFSQDDTGGDRIELNAYNDALGQYRMLRLDGSPVVFTQGNVGIGTTGPSEALDVVGDLEVSGVGQFGGITGTAYSAISDSGTATYAASDDDLYIEDILEVGGASYFAGTLTTTGQFTLGDGGDTGAINTSDWDISTTGVMTGISGITTDGVLLLPDGSVSAPALSFSGDTNTGLYRIGDDKISLITGGTVGRGITIDSSGNVGIGTTGPVGKLHTAISNNYNITNLDTYDDGIGFTQLAIRRSASDVIGTATTTTDGMNLGTIVFNGVDAANNFDIGAGIQVVQTGTANIKVPTRMILWTGAVNSENLNQLVLESTGNVGIGTTGPSEALDVVGDLEVSGVGQFGGITGTTYSAISDSGTATYAASDDDLYIEDILEVGGASYFSGTLTSNGQFTLGDGGDTGSINTSDWDISTTGVMTGISGITTDDVILLPDGTASAPALAFSGDTDTGIYRLAADKIGISTGATARIVVDSTGQVGIGTTGPTNLLHIRNTSGNAYVRAETTANNAATGMVLYRNDGTYTDEWYIYNPANSRRLSLGLAAAETLVLDSGGNVGIGTTGPSQLLDVGGNFVVKSDGYVGIGLTGPTNPLHVNVTRNEGAVTAIYNPSATGYGAYIQTGGTENTKYALQVDSNGGSTTGLYVANSGNVGIGTAGPEKLLHIQGPATAQLNYTLKLVAGLDTNINSAVGILFNNGIDANRGKGAIVYRDDGTSYNRGSFYFLNDAVEDVNNAALTDAVMVIKNSGNVGIGTTGPGEKLEVSGNIRVSSTDSRIRFVSPSSFNGEQYGRMEWWNENLAGIMAKISAVREASPLAPGALAFYTSANVDTSDNGGEGAWSEKMRITSSGNVGIGTTGPGAKLHVSNGLIYNDSVGATQILLNSAGDWATIQNDASSVFSLGWRNTISTDLGTPVLTWNTSGNVGIGTTGPSSLLEIASTAPTFRMTDTTASAKSLLITADGNLAQFEEAGGSANDLFVLDLANARVGIGTTAPGDGFTLGGSARHSRTSNLNAEYPGAVLTTFYGAGTDTSITGSMTADIEANATDLQRTYYEWTSTAAALNYYTVAVRVTLPQDFDAWQTSNALQVDFVTETTLNTQNVLDVRVYLESDVTTAVASSTGNASSVADTWATVTIDDSVLDDGSAPEWDAAGETAVIYLRMGSLTATDAKHVRVGDIKLNYLSKW